jgi:hypothetical protein
MIACLWETLFGILVGGVIGIALVITMFAWTSK